MMNFIKSFKVFQDIGATLERWNRRKFVRYGAPFFLLVIGSSFALKNFTSIRYEYRSTVKFDPKKLESKGVKVKEPGSVTLESEYESLKKLDIENWDNIRGPRPYEEDLEFEKLKLKQQAERAAERKKRRLENQAIEIQKSQGRSE